jgi:IMP cyclohydrolase
MGVPLLIREAMKERPYPGRACLLATVRGERVIVYFLTGRSEASRRRSLKVEAASLVVADADSSSHDSLRHYRAVVSEGEWIVVGNGSHVDEISTALVSGLGPFEIMSRISAEPDAPIYTPRIWVAVRRGEPTSSAILGHARRLPNGGTTRGIWSIDELGDDVAVLLTTYSGTVKDVSVTDGPMYVSCSAKSATDMLEVVWDSLDPQLRVGAIMVRPDANESMPVIGPLITNSLGN